MFKKMFKNLTDNLTEKLTDNLMNNQTSKSQENYAEQMRQAYGGQIDQQKFDSQVSAMGYTTINSAKEDPNDPLMQPIHGVTLFDYAAGAGKMGEGVSEDQICVALGIERPMWDEARKLWEARMKEDKSFNVANVYAKYYGEYKKHEKLGSLTPLPGAAPQTNVPSEEIEANLKRIEEDKYFFFEMQAAMQAAYDNGIDGAQWLLETIGITVSQFNSTGAKYMTDFGLVAQMMDFQDQKQKEYSAKFAQDLGGSIADDVQF
ncbi:hypothetical protein GCM10023231_02110 [Olivibacter ginsenosidimutans]|uniref:Uncharacterized protein n=1 Tax=Olivibacter ginsenosidimutans TaxID=1176537 RepID=A0ABP9ACH9_9SPHI